MSAVFSIINDDPGLDRQVAQLRIPPHSIEAESDVYKRQDQSEQVPAMLERYKSMIVTGGGKVHRIEDWGRRQLVYMINKLAKAHYLCVNIEADQPVMAELEHAFKFNDAVLRHLTVLKKKADTGPSSMMKTLSLIHI